MNQNVDLYRNGTIFGRSLSPDRTSRAPGALLQPIANANDTSVAEVRTAIDFANHVNAISSALGPTARRVLLSGTNPLLTPVLIGKLAKLDPIAMKAAVRQASRGLHPFAPAVSTDVPHLQKVWQHDLCRLQWAARHLKHAESAMARSDQTGEFAPFEFGDALSIRVAASALLHRLRRSVGSTRRVKEAAAFSTAQVATSCLNEMSLERARRLVEQVTHDLPLLLTRIEPPAATRRALWNVALDVHCTASKIADATRPLTRSKPKSLLNDSSEGPEDRPGTYVMVMTLKRSMSLRIGRLETFWLPAGYLLYVGSAFGGGGVRGRTRRHRQAIAPKMWNLDHVKAVARPVEIWWTHFEKKVECRWAMALADLEGYRCPAPGFGSNDCQTCPAHFYHRSDPPSAEAFTERIGQTIPDHGAIFRMALSDERLVPTGIHRDR